IAAINAFPVVLPLSRRNSSTAITTTSSRPCTVTCCGPSLRTFRTSSLKRALASCKSQYPDRGLGTRVFGIFGAAAFDLMILVMLTRIHRTSRLLKLDGKQHREPCRGVSYLLDTCMRMIIIPISVRMSRTDARMNPRHGTECQSFRRVHRRSHGRDARPCGGLGYGAAVLDRGCAVPRR